MMLFFFFSDVFDRDPGNGGTRANSQLEDKLLSCIERNIGENSSYILLLCWDTTRTKSLFFSRDTFGAVELTCTCF